MGTVEYFSKWRNDWFIMDSPTPGKIIEMKKYFYRIRINGIEHEGNFN